LSRLFEDIVALMREGILGTVGERTFSLDNIGAAVTQAESTGRQGKVLLVPAKQEKRMGDPCVARPLTGRAGDVWT
jgi:hypothetical protein